MSGCPGSWRTSERTRDAVYGPLLAKEHEAEARERHRAFFSGSSLGDRPALHVTVRDQASPPPWDTVHPPSKGTDLDSAWHVARIESELASTEYLADAMPTASVMVGTDVTDTAVLLGGDYEYRHGEAIICPDPGVFERPVPAFDPTTSFVRALEAVYRDVDAAVSGRAFVNTVMTLDALTTLSLMRGQLTLIRDMLERPETVRAHVEATERLVNAFYGHFYALLLELGHGESSGWFHCMAEGRFDVLRSDFSVMLSPELFDEFVVPALASRTSALDHALFNMDSTVLMRYLDSLAGIAGLDGVFWNPGPAEGAVSEHLDDLARIKERGLLLDVVAADVAEAVRIVQALGPDGLVIALPPFSNRADAQDAIAAVTGARRTKKGVA